MSELPENVDLRFLATQNQRILSELQQMRSDLKTTKDDVKDIALRTTLIEVRMGTMQTSLDKLTYENV